MSLRTGRGRARFGRAASKKVARPDNRLAFIDQATSLTLRATGREQLMQIVWIYEHPVDLDRLKHTYRNGGYGLLGRRSSVRRCLRPASVGLRHRATVGDRHR